MGTPHQGYESRHIFLRDTNARLGPEHSSALPSCRAARYMPRHDTRP